jgi:hypothetical protein
MIITFIYSFFRLCFTVKFRIDNLTTFQTDMAQKSTQLKSLFNTTPITGDLSISETFTS